MRVCDQDLVQGSGQKASIARYTLHVYPVHPALTNANIFAYATTVALIVPVLLVAILVDASRNTRRIGPVASKQSPDRVAIRQSRRTLLGVGVGAAAEIYCLQFILFVPDNDNQGVAVGNYNFVIVAAVATLILLYILLIPHVEFHIYNIRKDPGTVRWSILVGWAIDALFIANAAVNQFEPQSVVGHYAAYVWIILSLILTGAMITLTIAVIRRSRLIDRREEDREAEPTPGLDQSGSNIVS